MSLHKPALGVSGDEITVGRTALHAVDADAAVKRSVMRAGQRQVLRCLVPRCPLLNGCSLSR